MQPVLRSAIAVLRPFEERDAEAVREASRDPYITELVGLDPTGESSARAYVLRQPNRDELGLGYSWAITSPDTGRCQGQVGLWLRANAPDGSTGYIEEAHGRAAAGYWVRPSARDHGLAAEALSVIAAWALAQADVERVEVFIEPDNIASLLTARRAGFVEEGRLRSWQRIGDSRRDMIVMSRIPSDGPPEERGST